MASAWYQNGNIMDCLNKCGRSTDLAILLDVWVSWSWCHCVQEFFCLGSMLCRSNKFWRAWVIYTQTISFMVIFVGYLSTWFRTLYSREILMNVPSGKYLDRWWVHSQAGRLRIICLLWLRIYYLRFPRGWRDTFLCSRTTGIGECRSNSRKRYLGIRLLLHWGKSRCMIGTGVELQAHSGSNSAAHWQITIPRHQ